MIVTGLDWKTCRNGHTGYMVRHKSKPNSLTCTVCRKVRDGKTYQKKRETLISIYSQLLTTVRLMEVAGAGPKKAQTEVLATLRKKIRNLGGPSV